MISKFFSQYKWLLLVEFVIFLSYFQILHSFFQQDEWLSFAYKILTSKESFTSQLGEFFRPSVGHFQPLTTLVLQLEFYLFKLNFIGYSVVSLSLHLTNVALCFILTNIISKSRKMAVFVALLFGISASIYQATSWVMADIGIHFSTMLALVCLIYYQKFLEYKRRNFLYMSLFFLVLGLLFKESIIGIFVFLPIWHLFVKEKKQKINFELIFPILLTAIGYFLLRITMIFLPQSFNRDSLVTQTQSIKYLLLNVSSFPIIGVIQSVIPQDFLEGIAYFIASFLPRGIILDQNPNTYNLFVQGKLVDLVCLVFFILLSLLFLFMYSQNKIAVNAKMALFGFWLALANLPIFALAPERGGFITNVDSRNLYFICIGTSILIVSLLSFLKQRVYFHLFFLVLIIMNVYFLHLKLDVVSSEGKLRSSILNKFTNDHPTLQKKTIFYTRSDLAYYGLPEEDKILPFQSGLGQTLLIWYFFRSSLPDQFLSNKFLWGIKDQGYKEINGYGFGYFRDFSLLQETMNSYKITPDSVVAYSWESKKSLLKDITDDVRSKLEKHR